MRLGVKTENNEAQTLFSDLTGFALGGCDFSIEHLVQSFSVDMCLCLNISSETLLLINVAEKSSC